MEDRMYGVVLWADEGDQKAVIWCEDHGNLAYYNGTEASSHEGVSLDAGDLIEFELREESDCRKARNLQRIEVGFAPNLPEKIRGGRPKPHAKSKASNVLSFPGLMPKCSAMA